MTTALTVVGHLLDRPRIAYTPRDRIAVVRMTIRVQSDLHTFGSPATVPPIDYPVKAAGPMAQNAYDGLAAGDRVVVIGVPCPESDRDPHTGDHSIVVWLYAQEIGASFNGAPRPVPTGSARDGRSHARQVAAAATPVLAAAV